MSIRIFETFKKKDGLIIMFTMDTVLKSMNMYNFDLLIQETIYTT